MFLLVKENFIRVMFLSSIFSASVEKNSEKLYFLLIMYMCQAPQMVFFKDAVQHILRAARVFRQPGGHMLMVSTFILISYQYLPLKNLPFCDYTIHRDDPRVLRCTG